MTRSFKDSCSNKVPASPDQEFAFTSRHTETGEITFNTTSRRVLTSRRAKIYLRTRARVVRADTLSLTDGPVTDARVRRDSRDAETDQ